MRAVVLMLSTKFSELAFKEVSYNSMENLDFTSRLKGLIWVMLDIPSQYMHYCLVLLCEVYCVIV